MSEPKPTARPGGPEGTGAEPEPPQHERGVPPRKSYGAWPGPASTYVGLYLVAVFLLAQQFGAHFVSSNFGTAAGFALILALGPVVTHRSAWARARVRWVSRAVACAAASMLYVWSSTARLRWSAIGIFAAAYILAELLRRYLMAGARAGGA